VPARRCRNTSCKWEFCWVCSGPWKDHSGSFYSCNKYDSNADTESPDGKKKDTSRAALERYLHYYTRFTNHHNSLKFEIDAKTKMEAKVRGRRRSPLRTCMLPPSQDGALAPPCGAALSLGC
jgi:hypothetical protein